MGESSLLHFVEYELQIIALAWMAVLYGVKAYQLSRLPMPWEKAPPSGDPRGGAIRSYAKIFMPWTMETGKKHPWRWFEFAAYHVGALVAIIITFTLPFAPGFMSDGVRRFLAVLIAPAFLVGFVKLYRRMSSSELRAISTPDDYFSVAALQLFFGAGIMVLLNFTEFWRMTYFLITAAFLFYVPFSKISHYVYYFFAHQLTGRRYGWRGVIPSSGGTS